MTLTLALVHWLLAAAIAAPVTPVLAKELNLREALDSARTTSPDLKAAQSKEAAAQSDVGIAKSAYYPKIEAQAIDSTGLAASNGALGIQGVMGSSFRSGLAAGVYVTQTLYDFGRTSNRVDSFEHQMEGQKNEVEITRYKVNYAIIQAYYTCSLNRTQKESWQQLLGLADVVKREVERFVRTGQRSIVDRYLAETQKQEAITAIADYSSREQESQKRLAILMGRTAADPLPVCPVLNFNDTIAQGANYTANPFVARANADVLTVQSQLRAARAENLPTLVAMGSAGYLENVRLVDNYNYSLGIGLSIPLFEGYRITEEVNRSSAQLQEKNFALQAVQQFLADLNQQFNETIQSTQARLDHLGPELKLANDALDVAKQRYFSFKGDLLDVRAALTNLTRVSIDENETITRHLIAQKSMEVLNGAQ